MIESNAARTDPLSVRHSQADQFPAASPRPLRRFVGSSTATWALLAAVQARRRRTDRTTTAGHNHNLPGQDLGLLLTSPVQRPVFQIEQLIAAKWPKLAAVASAPTIVRSTSPTVGPSSVLTSSVAKQADAGNERQTRT